MAARSLKCFQRDCLEVPVLDGQSKCCLLPVKQRLRKLGNQAAAMMKEGSQYGSRQDKEAIRGENVYLKTESKWKK